MTNDEFINIAIDNTQAKLLLDLIKRAQFVSIMDANTIADVAQELSGLSYKVTAQHKATWFTDKVYYIVEVNI